MNWEMGKDILYHGKGDKKQGSRTWQEGQG